MPFTSTQIIVVGLAGLATAVGVASATIQHSRSPQSPNPTITESVTSPRNPIVLAPTNNGESKQPEPLQATISPIESEESAPQPAKTPVVEPSLITGVSESKNEPVVITPPNSGCRIIQAVVNDPNPPLNVRSHPRVADSKIVGTLKNNSFVTIVEEQNGWFRITDPVAGWIAKNRTESSCPNIKQQINFLPGGDEAIVKGRIIGGGSHSYIIRAAKGQTMTVRNRKNVFPQILTPDGKLLTGEPYQDNQTEWTGKIPVTGNYTFQLDSNFRGYEYEFSVKVR
ncbi:MAG: SH3 domain-containing protein [Microcoleus sp. CAN_BIN18]|nr:SH3 domain-containing protein [Microcoleus sp. CAN_BIN18]